MVKKTITTKAKTSTAVKAKKKVATPAKKTPTKKTTTAKSKTAKKDTFATKICIKYDAGFPNNLYVRGEGAGLNWNKGVPCKNVGPNEWIWEVPKQFITCKFKVLINDEHYEQGRDHILHAGSLMEYTPKF
jgi:hypothetical protein